MGYYKPDNTFEELQQIAKIVERFNNQQMDDVFSQVRELRYRTEQAKEICEANGYTFAWMNSMEGFAYYKEDNAVYGAFISEYSMDNNWAEKASLKPSCIGDYDDADTICHGCMYCEECKKAEVRND